MKVVILCGGKGTRLASPTETIPKTLALVSGRPIIWHIMSIYASYGFNEFILPLGFGGDKIKEYFWTYEWKNCDFTKEIGSDKVTFLNKTNNWKVTFVDTGIETMTGGRIKKIEKFIDEDTFMLTYGDGLSDVNIDNLLKFHKENGQAVTVTGVERKSQYGILTSKNGIVTAFDEKAKLDGIINGGFFVMDKKVFDYIEDDSGCVFEQEPLRNLVKSGQLAVYNFKGYWTAIDTNKDLIYANKTWEGVK
jgi:glucose-1-phosphate cytidylyltransferase